jgi:CPA2 family monovalent cation:H+ antiporter-2
MPHSEILPQAVLVFGAAVVVAGLFRMLRAPAVIGFLFTGMLIGPSGFRLITPSAVAQLSELGLVLLLFTVGLELSAEPLLRNGRSMLAAAGIQIVLSAGPAAALAGMFLPLPAAAVIGLALALSSTAIVLKQLGDLRQLDSPAGVIVAGVLLIQDLLAILIMLVLPLAAGAARSGWGASLGRSAFSAVLLVGGAVVARRVLPQVAGAIVRTGGRELMALFAVLMASAGALAAGMAGWSLALGACVAGLLLAESDVRHQLFADIVPFRDVFNALFFVSMGMLVDLPAVLRQPGMVVLAVAGTLLVKAVVASAGAALAGWPMRVAIQAGLGLCTASEFGYILGREAERLELISGEAFTLLTAVIVGTMIAGALLVPVSDRVALAAGRWREGPARRKVDGAPAGGQRQHVIIVGYGLNGHNLASVLSATKIDYSVVEMNRALADEAREGGGRVIVGDATQRAILDHAGLAEARALVVAINDQRATRRIVAQARAARPDLFILARTRYTSELEELYRLGARQVIPEEFETSIEIFAHLLKHLGIPDNVVEAQVAMVRAGRYGMLRGRAAAASPADLAGLLEATATQTFLVEATSPASGRTIRELDLRARTGATIIAVVRGGHPTANPPAGFRIEAGDILVLVGAHREVDQAKANLGPGAGEAGASAGA